MPSVCLYFQLHQPLRLKGYSALDIGRHMTYFHHRLNRELLHKVTDRCYLPATTHLLQLIQQHKGQFRFAFSISGILLEQLESLRPDLMRVFKQLAETGCVEFVSQPYYHSLAFVYSREEFFRQIILHKEKLWKHFQQDPQVFQNTELIHHNQLAYFVRQMGFRGVLTESVPGILQGRSAEQTFQVPDLKNFQLLLRNQDAVIRRGGAVLRADAFARQIQARTGSLTNLLFDLETFGYRLSAEEGIFAFLDALPAALLSDTQTQFRLPTEALEAIPATETFDAAQYISGTPGDPSLAAWQGNELQKEALHKVYELESVVLATEDEALIRTWGMLQAADHFYYMNTDRKDSSKDFGPFVNAYDAYLAFMNVIADFQLKLRHVGRG